MENKGMKFDENKLHLELIPPSLIIGVGEVLTYGAKKYAPNNWRYVTHAKERYQGALMRHWYAYLAGEKLDEESGLPHLYHVATNIAFLIELEKEKPKSLVALTKPIESER